MPTIIPVPRIDPVDHQMKLYRYMSLAKFISLLTTSMLFVPCIEKLRNQDRHEGTIHQNLVDQINSFPGTDDVIQKLRSRFGEEAWASIGSPNLGTIISHVARDQRRIFASCWHIAIEQSILMWSRYAPGLESVAIETTVGNLLESIQGIDNLRAGVVRYDPDRMVEGYGTGAECFYKNPIFKGENEFRVVLYSEKKEEIGIGIPLSVNLKCLIQKIYIAPDAEQWFINLVARLVENNGIATRIITTTLKTE